MPEDTSRKPYKVVLPSARGLIEMVDAIEAGTASIPSRGLPANFPWTETQTPPFHAAPAQRPNPVSSGSFPALAASLTPPGLSNLSYPSDSNVSLPRTQNTFVSPADPWSSSRVPRLVPSLPPQGRQPTLRRVPLATSMSHCPPICSCNSPRVYGNYTSTDRVLFTPLSGPPERGISMADIFSGGGLCMQEPDAEPMTYLGTMDYVLNINGRDVPVKSIIPSNCVHLRITRFHLAKWIAILFRSHLDIPLQHANLISFSSAGGGMWKATITAY